MGRSIPAAQGQRFVVPSCKRKGEAEFLDLGGRDELSKILIYDAPFQGKPNVLDLKGSATKGANLIAVSPDGTKLAVLNGLNLSVYSLPVERTDHSETVHQ